jgi:hypothetical protein
MADAEHVRVVLAGRDAVAAWRKENPDTRLDLRRAELLQQQLNGCDLSGALMEWADLRWADLVGCDLSGAHCTQADFHKADLTNAVFDDGEFVRANFEDAKLHNVSFANAIFGGTRFINSEIADPRGLDRAVHRSSSLLDDETLSASPELPEAFLKGCGLQLPFEAIVYRVILGGPSDVELDVRAARETVHEWNDQYAQQSRSVLLPIWWKTHATPELGARPQSILNIRLVDRGDVLVAVFWSRLGTPTGAAESGTAEEIERFMDAGKPVLAYFCGRPLPQDFDEHQWKRLKEFRGEIRRRGLVGEYTDAGDLARQLTRHLSATLDRLTTRGG